MAFCAGRVGRAALATCVMLMLAAVVATGGLAPASAQTGPPPQEPQLRIEAGTHTAILKRIGLSADEKLMVTGTYDKTARIWSIPDGRLLRTLRVPIGPGHDGKIFGVAISPDGRTVVAGGWDASYSFGGTHFLYVFDVASGAVRRRLGPLPNVVHHIAFSADGTKVAAGLGTEGFKVFDPASGKVLGEDKDYANDIYGLEFDRSGRLVVTCYDGTVRLYAANFKRIAKITAPGGKQPSGIAFSPDASKIAIAYDDTNKVDILSGQTLAPQYAANTAGLEDTSNLSIVAWSADGRFLFAGGQYRTVVDGKYEHRILRWADGGRGKRDTIAGPSLTILDLKPYGKSGIAYGAGEPSLGLVDGAGKRVLHVAPVTADLRDKRDEHFVVSADGKRVRFGLKDFSEDPWLFDAQRLLFEASPVAPPELRRPPITGLEVTDWKNKLAPKLNGKPLELSEYEQSRALAIMPDKSGMIIGSDWSIRRFDAKGQMLWHRASPGVTWGVNLSADGRIILAAYGDGTIRWHRSSDGAELMALFMHVPADPNVAKRWVLYTPKGYYTASAGGEDLIGWHVNRGWDEAADFFPASRFRDRFHRPDVVAKVLDLLDEDKAIDEANAQSKRKRDDDIRSSLPPVIEILSPADGSRFSGGEMTVEYTVRSPAGQAITNIDVLLDGRPVTEASRSVGPSQQSGRQRLTVKLPPRDVELSLIARTARTVSEASTRRLLNGTVASEAAARPPAAVALGQVQEFEKPKLYALVIGVSVYANPDLKLGYAAKDATDIEAAVKRQRGGGLYREVETRLITDAKATAENIRSGFNWLEKEVTGRDVAMVFLAGHGVTDLQQRFWFLPATGDPDNLRATAIPKSDFEDVLRGLPGKILMFIDACHAGKGIERTRYVTRGGGGAADVTGLVNEMSSTENGIVMFASSTGRELSLEDEQWQNGAFTKALIEGLAGKADYNKDGAVTVKELDLWVSERVKELTGKRQHPVARKPETIPDFPLALAR